MYLQSEYSLVTTIHEEKKYDLNVNIVIKNLLLDVPAKRVLSNDYNSWGKEIWFECEYCDQNFAARCTCKASTF